jgi:hypothetical protein
MSDAVVLTVNLLKCQLLGLADEAEDQAPGYQVQSCVEADCVACQWGSVMIKLFNSELTGSNLCHRSHHCRECQAENTS